MKVTKISRLIIRLKVLNFVCSEATIFVATLCMFLTPTLLIWGIELFSILFVLFCHYFAYIFKFRKIYRDELLPEKRKIEYFINILKKRRIERQFPSTPSVT
jgi:hypothetical protein